MRIHVQFGETVIKLVFIVSYETDLNSKYVSLYHQEMAEGKVK